ncbi:MAG: PIN domain-containing protein [Hyphomicrobiaceae bacterium]|nr:MAG: PIN domain-containing protein [Hyphomicrobiaceae bacterium]
MSVDRLLDTNVLVYAVSSAPEDSSKQNAALSLLEEPFGISGQILQEFYVNVTRKIRIKLQAEEALAWVEMLSLQPCVPIDADIVKRGVELSERHRISYWDGAIVAAAEVLGAKTLFTEDLAHERRYGSVQAINPFIGL